MNILYIIGNGFDIAQGLKTSYSDFYCWYQIQPEPDSKAIRDLRSNISKDHETWADMELGLGQYTANVNPEDIDKVYYDLSDSLREYLKNEQRRYNPSEKVKELIKKDLLTPYTTLLEGDKVALKEFKKQKNRIGETDVIDIITLNYTDSLEKSFNVADSKPLGTFLSGSAILGNILHAHGDLSTTLIMGVNDRSQLNNEEFKNNEDICDLLVKPQTCYTIRAYVPQLCEELIQKADLIIIFGASLGETDTKWWRLVAQRIINHNARLIIYEYIDKPLDMTRGHTIGAKRRKVIQKFLSRIGTMAALRTELENKTFVNFSHNFMSGN